MVHINECDKSEMDLRVSQNRVVVSGDTTKNSATGLKSMTVDIADGSHPPATAIQRLKFCESAGRILLTWENISVYLPPTRKRCCKTPAVTAKPTQILYGVSGVAYPGNLLAILGASGCGKTTLLNVLNYRNSGELRVEGDIQVNGKKIGKGLPRISGYVQQQDMMIGTLTVKEHLWFQALLRMDRDVPRCARKKRVDDVINEFSLNKCVDTFIGLPNQLRGISGGEKKRLAFASEVLTNPQLMFCDEPTSGLDSYMAENVVETLKMMTNKGRTIICTIHQPSSEVFAMFDRVLIMAEGQTIFLGRASDAMDFFRDCGYPCPVNFNPADHYIYTLAVRPGSREENNKKIKAICQAYTGSVYAKEMEKTLQAVVPSDPDITLEEIDATTDKSPYKASWWTQFYVLFLRNWFTSWRQPVAFRSKLLQSVIQGLLVGAIFFQQQMDQAAILNISGALFFFQITMSLIFLYYVILVFPQEFLIFSKEHHDGMYRVDTYYLAKTMSELPSLLLLPTIYTSIVYWMIGLYSSVSAFFLCLVTIILVCNTANSLGYVLSASSQNVELSLLLAGILIHPQLMIGGFFVLRDSIPPWMLWLKYLSMFTYSNEILMVNQWRNIDYLACNEEVNTTTVPICLRNGQDVIDARGFSEDNLPFDFGMLIVLLLGMRTVAFLFLLLRSRKSYRTSKP